MRTFSIFTLGCKVNQYEGAQIRQYLENFGLTAVKPEEKPDLFIINTCCVTSTASAKSRQFIQRARRLNEQAAIIVCGCLTAFQELILRLRSGQDLAKKNNIHLITNRNAIAAKLQKIIGGARFGRSLNNYTNNSNIAQQSYIKPDSNQKINTSFDYAQDGFTDLTSLPKLPLLTSFKEQTRAFLKVQDGCDGVCSYCIIPKVRPEVQSKPLEEAVFEAKNLVAAGHKEIVVTGVNLGSYGKSTTRKTQIADCRLPIADLLEELARIPGLARLRVSSLEPGDISEQLLDIFCAHKNIMPHIHLSVQSGSDAVLKRMCRPYSAAELRDKISLIKKQLDRPAITCDMIVGFPGETEEDFAATMELAKWAGFSKIHVFAFSPREGTAAAKMKEQIGPKVVKERALALRKLGDELGYKFCEQFIGEVETVLIEGSKNGQAFGHCERYFMVNLDPLLPNQSENHSGAGRQIRKGEIFMIKITAVTEEGAAAEEIKD